MFQKIRIYMCIAFLSLLMVSASLADTVLYCNTELSTGFAKKNNQWEIANFVDERYTIKFNTDYTVLSGLNKHFDFSCSTPAFENIQRIVCIGNWDQGDVFTYNIDNNRFIYSDSMMFGFINGKNAQNPDTNSIHAGTCTNF